MFDKLVNDIPLGCVLAVFGPMIIVCLACIIGGLLGGL